MSKKITVMLIDDNRIDLFIHNEFINQMKIANTVFEYAYASDALKFLLENEASKWPDLILLDIHMPIMNGFEFLEKYVTIPESLRRNCKIIIVSSSLNTEDILKAKESPEVFQLLEKPLNTEKLRQLLESENMI